MSFEIEDPGVQHLARTIAALTGESMTQVLEEALRERLARLERQKSRPSVDELMAIAQGVAVLANGTTVDHGAFLYDENGLPR